MTNRHKSFESAINVWYIYCGDGFIGHIERMDMLYVKTYKIIYFKYFKYVQFIVRELCLSKAVQN